MPTPSSKRAAMPLRIFFIVGFTLAMPLLAMPAVATWVDELLYGTGSSVALDEASQANSQKSPPTRRPRAVSENRPASSGTGALTSRPPVMREQFAKPPAAQTQAANTLGLGGDALAKIREIEQQISALGGTHFSIDQAPESEEFVCQAMVLVDEASVYSLPFSASAADPLVAAQQLRASIEGWRTAKVPSRGESRTLR